VKGNGSPFPFSIPGFPMIDLATLLLLAAACVS
jgi:hypothetical protein